MPRLRSSTGIVLATLLASALGTAGSAAAQSVHPVSPRFDGSDAPSTYPFPGFDGAFRQQIVISSARLVAVRGKQLTGLAVRRDLFRNKALSGGVVDMEIRLAIAPNSPARAKEVFAQNAPNPRLVFRGSVTVPNAPAFTTPPANPWSAEHAVSIHFDTPFSYATGDLCVDITGRPVPGKEPDFWYVDCEWEAHSGNSRALGTSCSPVADNRGATLYTEDHRLQIGSTLRVIALGRTGATPILLPSATVDPVGVELSAMGAPGCRLHVGANTLIPLAYGKAPFAGQPSSLFFEFQLPSDSTLLGKHFFMQAADDERGLGSSQRSNPAALTTSNALDLVLSMNGPGLGLSIVTSERVAASESFPDRGRVDVSMAPVLRLTY